MTARDLISQELKGGLAVSMDSADASVCVSVNNQYVDANSPVLEVFRRMMSYQAKMLAVVEDGKILGYIDALSMLDGLHRLVIPRDDCSVIEIECSPIDYSASRIAHAVEDSDAHLLDLLSRKVEEESLRVLLRVSHIDPSAVVRSLERYGYTVVSAYGSEFNAVGLSYERLAELALYLNI